MWILLALIMMVVALKAFSFSFTLALIPFAAGCWCFSKPSLYGDGIHLTVAHKREWSYGFKPDNKTVPLPCYPESPYDHQRESSTS
ncbi:hypothetical protein VI35_07995 [Aeromonas caviae]|nr:hypothetical protein VI35_07995 [Aeromonas caviae]